MNDVPDIPTVLQVASTIPRLQTLDDIHSVATWVTSIEAALDRLGLTYFITSDQIDPLDNETREQWDRKRATVVWILKTSLVDVHSQLVEHGPVSPLTGERPLVVEMNPRRVFMKITEAVGGLEIINQSRND